MLFTKNRHLARRCFFARGGRRGCAPGAPARPAAVPAYRRRRAPFARSPFAQAKPCRAAAFYAAAGPSAAPAGPLPDLRPPQAPVFGRFGRGCHSPALFLNSRFFPVRSNYFGVIDEFILTVVCVQTVYLLLCIIKPSAAEAHDIRRLQQRGNKSFVAGKVHLRFRCIAIAG